MAEHATSGASAQLVDTVRPCIPLHRYCFLSAGGNITLSGYFCDIEGFPVSVAGAYSFTGTITPTTPVTLLTLFGLTTLPNEGGGTVMQPGVKSAAGFVGQMNGTVAFCAASQDMLTVPSAVSTDMVANTARYPQMAASNAIRLGRA